MRRASLHPSSAVRTEDYHLTRLSCSGHDLTGAQSVRTRANVDRLIAQLADTTEVVVTQSNLRMKEVG